VCCSRTGEQWNTRFNPVQEFIRIFPRQVQWQPESDGILPGWKGHDPSLEERGNHFPPRFGGIERKGDQRSPAANIRECLGFTGNRSKPVNHVRSDRGDVIRKVLLDDDLENSLATNHVDEIPPPRRVDPA
jgi:hypothetical protein